MIATITAIAFAFFSVYLAIEGWKDMIEHEKKRPND